MEQPPTRAIWVMERAEHLIVWSFRILATGCGRCPPLSGAYSRLFGDRATDALTAVHAAVAMIGTAGRRKLRIHAPGCINATADEAALVAMFAAAQDSLRTGQDHRLHAHLAWILGGTADESILFAVQTVADHFARCGLDLPLQQGSPPLATEAQRPGLRVVH